jgi:hypothetical protein
MRTIDDLIVNLEYGYERAEGVTWMACSILADNDCEALLNDLKNARDARNELLRLLEEEG